MRIIGTVIPDVDVVSLLEQREETMDQYTQSVADDNPNITTCTPRSQTTTDTEENTAQISGTNNPIVYTVSLYDYSYSDSFRSIMKGFANLLKKHIILCKSSYPDIINDDSLCIKMGHQSNYVTEYPTVRNLLGNQLHNKRFYCPTFIGDVIVERDIALFECFLISYTIYILLIVNDFCTFSFF